MLKIYGLKNCDTCKAALKWLSTENIEHKFIDIRNPVPASDLLKDWLSKIGHKTLVNRRSTSWRNLSDIQKNNTDDTDFLALIKDNPTLIKRPIFVNNDQITVGFSAKNTENITKIIK